MFSDRKSSIPLTDPYTALPRAPRDRSASAHPRETARLRSASVSMVAGNTPHASEASKRHTHHALQSQSPVGRNRIASLPAAQLETFSRGRSSIPMPSRPSKINNPIRLSIGDKPLPGHPRRLENLDPKALLRTLNSLLGPKSQRIPDYLDVDYLMALHERDLMEREQRDAIQLKARTDRAQGNASCSGLTVFGSSLREATMYASNGTVLGGYEHDIPIAVFRCVQELCRYGFHKPTPPRQPKPDRDRLLALISAFDSEPQFGLRTSFDCPSELREIYALLTTYLFALPDPILSSEMFEALWAWCVLPSLRSTEFLENDGRSRRHVATDSGVRIAQHLLHLLPLPNFSLIVYMMGFFQRLPHLITEDVGRAVFAGRCAKPASSTDGRAERSETMARWFLDRWDGIFKGLFAPPEIHQMEDVAPRSSNPWSPCDSSRDRFGSSQFVSSPLEIADEGTPRVAQEDPPADKRAPLLRLPSDGLFQSAVGAESDASSVSSSPALGERLLDLTLEFAEDAQLDLEKKRTKRYAVCPVRLEAAPDIVSDIASVSDDSGYQSPGDDALPCPHPPEEVEGELSYRAALRRISLLERELERSDVAVSDAISETFRARDQVKELEGKLKEAGKHPPVLDLRLDARAMDDWHAVLQSDTEALKVQLTEARKERDAALRLVEEVKKLMGGGRAF
ncbi:hypothetical protein B0H15DRAFT_836354 [Mycena belliarum]|uniref:Rho-GAP domain-containing protein n=1 Tax=Mycena belliarum TaxID=1033014 RepID=A0AAD6U5C4_9AGAR|nr:hypothetical protein B0H15DRAFT_836354 [Mycena belliae]